MHAYVHDVADRWLLKDDTEANEVMESGNEFHSVIVLAAKDFWNWVEAQRGILSLCLVVDPLTGLSHRTRSSWFIGNATCSFRILYRKVNRRMHLRSTYVYELPHDPAGSLSLNSFKRFTVFGKARIPYGACIFHTRSDKCNVGQCFNSSGVPFRFLLMKPKFWLALAQIMLTSKQIIRYCHSEVGPTSHCQQMLTRNRE